MSASRPTFPRRVHRYPAAPCKIERVKVGAHLHEVAYAAGITATRLSLVERGLAQPTPEESKALDAVLTRIAQEPRS